MTVALAFHDIAEPGRRDEVGFPGPLAARYKLTPQLFEAHLDQLAAAHVVVGTLGEAARPAAALTFDDGGASAIAAAAALERHGWAGHFFITTALIGTSGFLDAAGVRELRDRGHVVGSHSHRHPTYMGALAPELIADEWRTSRAILGEILGEAPLIASVPGGYVSPAVVEQAAAAGYRLLMTSNPTTRTRHHDELAVIGRFAIRATTPAVLSARYVSRAPLARGRLWLAWQAKAVPRRVSPGLYDRLRRLGTAG